MAKLTFFFDPICPWAWRTSLWVREVRKQRDLDITWKVFSLSEINRGDDPLAEEHAKSDAVLRALVLARRQGGNDAVDRLYLALGRARHERREDLQSDVVVKAALQEAGLARSLLAQALDDPSTDQEVMAEHREAAERYGAFGVPWLVAAGQEFGFYGPIITVVPKGDAAVDLWEHTSFLLTQPYFYELKRDRG
jgi:2-hydroxychromene-2-carboxylate isomerase